MILLWQSEGDKKKNERWKHFFFGRATVVWKAGEIDNTRHSRRRKNNQKWGKITEQTDERWGSGKIRDVFESLERPNSMSHWVGGAQKKKVGENWQAL